MTPWQTALTVAILASAAVSLAALAVVVWLWRGMRDERDEMEQRRRMAAAINRGALKPRSLGFRVVTDDEADRRDRAAVVAHVDARMAAAAKRWPLVDGKETS